MPESRVGEPALLEPAATGVFTDETKDERMRAFGLTVLRKLIVGRRSDEAFAQLEAIRKLQSDLAEAHIAMDRTAWNRCALYLVL